MFHCMSMIDCSIGQLSEELIEGFVFTAASQLDQKFVFLKRCNQLPYSHVPNLKVGLCLLFHQQTLL